MQGAYTGFRLWTKSAPAGSPACDPDARADQWITEGTAAYVQVRWYERTHGLRYGHPLTGSPRKAWARYFDQPLDWGSLPFKEHRQPDGQGDVNSWYCSYGSWYFWYAVGEMLAGTNDDARTDYLRFVFAQPGPWEKTGVAMVDAGLKEAAAHHGALEGYSHGLYDLYPEFVAQYLDDDPFYEHVRAVELGSPGLFETEVQDDRDLLPPLAAHAWRLRVQLPGDTAQRSTLRVTLDAGDGSDRDNLHLIIDDGLAQRPALPDTPYTRETLAPKRGGDPTPTEFLIRVANVGRDAAATPPAAYRLKIELEGYYGDPAAGSTQPFDPEHDAAAIAAELPPGFDIRGPDETWRCSGDAKAKALFAIDTPDRTADSLERSTTEFLNDDHALGQVMKSLQKMQQQGMDIGVDLDAMRAQMEQAQRQARDMKEQLRPEMERQAAQAAAEARSHQSTQLRATFASGDDCQLIVAAEWPGRAEVDAVTATEFSATVYSRARTEKFANLARDAHRDMAQYQAQAEAMKQQCTWLPCKGDGTDEHDCNPGRLRLEAARADRLVGTFNFDVVHMPSDLDIPCPGGVQAVSGHFSATSTVEDARTVMDIFLPGRAGLNVPGMPILDMEDDD